MWLYRINGGTQCEITEEIQFDNELAAASFVCCKLYSNVYSGFKPSPDTSITIYRSKKSKPVRYTVGEIYGYVKPDKATEVKEETKETKAEKPKWVRVGLNIVKLENIVRVYTGPNATIVRTTIDPEGTIEFTSSTWKMDSVSCVPELSPSFFLD